MNWDRFLPFTDLRNYTVDECRADFLSALSVIFLAVPQGIAYAMIAGMPPAMGLYAAAIPTIVGSLFRSSLHVIAGPSNAVSLLVGSVLALHLNEDPAVLGITLALMVGLMQVAAGFLRLGVLIDYICSPVILGYITGAGILIGVGQLPNLTATMGATGTVFNRLSLWWSELAQANLWAVGIGVGTILLIIGLRRWNRQLPAPIIAMGIFTLVSYWFDLHEKNITRLVDLYPVESGLPPLTLPDLELVFVLFPLAGAIAVLSLVESSAVGRAIALKTGHRIDSSVEFVGQGLSNLTAAFCGGYPVSGSLSRSILNEQAGAKTRLAGVYNGLLMLGILLFLGPLVNETPLASLAGLLVVIAWDLVDMGRVRLTMKGSWGDRASFWATLLGTWTLTLDEAIYVGVGVSFIFLVRHFNRLQAYEISLDSDGNWAKFLLEGNRSVKACEQVKIIQLQGYLFFGLGSKLREILATALDHKDIKVVIFHLSGCTGMDITISEVFRELSLKCKDRRAVLVISGLDKGAYQQWERIGLLRELGVNQVFVVKESWDKVASNVLSTAWSFFEHPISCNACEEGCPYLKGTNAKF